MGGLVWFDKIFQACQGPTSFIAYERGWVIFEYRVFPCFSQWWFSHEHWICASELTKTATNILMFCLNLVERFYKEPKYALVSGTLQNPVWNKKGLLLLESNIATACTGKHGLWQKRIKSLSVFTRYYVRTHSTLWRDICICTYFLKI
jgi:hypothetical protein